MKATALLSTLLENLTTEKVRSGPAVNSNYKNLNGRIH